jgi:hypothetical protein
MMMKMMMIYPGALGFRWTTIFPNGHVIYACATSSVTLPWKFVTSSGDSITSMEWYVKGHSEELMAMDDHGHFVTLPAFANCLHVGLFFSTNLLGRLSGTNFRGTKLNWQ